jgi:hypothetical protein
VHEQINKDITSAGTAIVNTVPVLAVKLSISCSGLSLNVEMRTFCSFTLNGHYDLMSNWMKEPLIFKFIWATNETELRYGYICS